MLYWRAKGVTMIHNRLLGKRHESTLRKCDCIPVFHLNRLLVWAICDLVAEVPKYLESVALSLPFRLFPSFECHERISMPFLPWQISKYIQTRLQPVEKCTKKNSRFWINITISRFHTLGFDVVEVLVGSQYGSNQFNSFLGWYQVLFVRIHTHHGNHLTVSRNENERHRIDRLTRWLPAELTSWTSIQAWPSAHCAEDCTNQPIGPLFSYHSVVVYPTRETAKDTQ